MRRFLLSSIIAMAISSQVSQPLQAQESDKPSGKLSGVFFMDYYYNLQRDTGIANLKNTMFKGDEDLQGFQIRRINITYDYKFNAKFSSRFRLESDEANFTTNLSGNKANKFGMFVKDAWVRWNYAGSHELYFGIQGPPSFEISEKFWGNRYIEKTIMDGRGICSSRDLGLSLKGKVLSSGKVLYWVMLANGSPSLPEADKYKRYYGHLEIKPIDGMAITLYADYQARAAKANAFLAGNSLPNGILTSALFAGYQKKDKLSFGAEAYYMMTENGTKLPDSYTSMNGYGLSVFGTYWFAKQWNAFARYDLFEPNSDEAVAFDSRNLAIGGIGFKPSENFVISGNVVMESFEQPDNYTIKSSVTPRITLSWTF